MWQAWETHMEPYHHGMMLSRIGEDGGDRLQTRNVDGTTWNEQSRAAEKGCSSSTAIASR
jgi:hypothetical protein